MKNCRHLAKAGSSESGQAMILMLLIFSIVMLGAIAFSVDMGMLWYHRQSAQNAADATCTAGAMDLLVDAAGSPTTHQGFTNGTAFDCKAHPTYAPCVYAARNGYDSSNLTPGNFVQVSFPKQSDVTGVPASAKPGATIPNSFMRVDVTDNVQTWFSGLLSGKTTQTVRAMSVCGVVLEQSPVPMVILHKTLTKSLQGNGTPTIHILGGPPKSIQVNSSSTTAVGFGGTIDLSKGGPNYDGSQLGTWGGPASPTGNFLPNATFWIDHSAPVSDPFQNVPAPNCTALTCPIQIPSDVAANGNCNTKAHIQNGDCVISYSKSASAGAVGKAHGCPDTAGCVLFTAGYYNTTLTLGQGSAQTYIFDPGVYYMNDGIKFLSNSLVRPSTFTPAAPNNIGGTVFFVKGSQQKCSGQNGLMCFGANSGSKGTKGGVDSFALASSVCPGGSIDPKLLAKLPPGGTTLTGNVFLAPCTGTWGDQTGAGKNRGILFFGDRSSSIGGGYGGGGAALFAGSIYFHQCRADGTGLGCNDPPTGYNAVLDLQGAAGSTSYILGEIIVDRVTSSGNPDISMVLNPNKTNSILKATLVPWSSTN